MSSFVSCCWHVFGDITKKGRGEMSPGQKIGYMYVMAYGYQTKGSKD